MAHVATHNTVITTRHGGYFRNPESLSMQVSGKPFQLYSLPIVKEVLKLHYTNQKVAVLSISLSTLRTVTTKPAIVTTDVVRLKYVCSQICKDPQGDIVGRAP
jgi:hypothetical protein